MDEHYGFLSIIPPIVAIFLAIRTKQVFVSLTFGIFIGYLIIQNFNPFTGFLETLNAFVKVFADAGNTRTVVFTLLVGSLIMLIQVSGGVAGFIEWLNKIVIRLESKSSYGRNKIVQALAGITGLLIFVESNISILTVGTLYRPIFEKYNISREKLAYLADSCSAPSCILVPFNAWGAYIMGLIVLNELENPFQVLFSSLPYNFYPLLAILMVFTLILTGKDFGPMKNAETRVKTTGQLMDEGSTPMMSAEITEVQPEDPSKTRAYNMVIPVLVMVVSVPIMLLYTGWKENFDANGTMGQIIEAIGNGSGSSAVLYAVTFAILTALVMYMVQRIFTFRKVVDHTIAGMSGMVSLALLMVLAFALGSLCKQLGTGFYVAEISKAWLSPGLVPFVVFIVSCFIAFSTGTSWGTFAIMISIAIPMAQVMDANLYMAIAAALGGGVFGDHCSPISDTTIISSMAAATDHVDHVKTQLPYALIAGGIAALFYLIIGIL